MNRANRRNPARQSPARIELRIGRLVIDNPGTGEHGELVAAMTAELRAVLARELAAPGRAAGLARSPAGRLRAAVSLPPAGSPGGDAGAGRAIGAALARAVTGRRGSSRQPGGTR
jgi:hypothetical protein